MLTLDAPQMRRALGREPDAVDECASVPIRLGVGKAVTDDTQELFHAGAVSPKGFDDA
jgi:hypothetical protein